MGTIGLGVIGFSWMGRVHAQAHARLRHHFPDVGLVPELVAVADEVPGRAEQAAAQFGFAAATTAVTLARRLVGEGAIGRVTHARFAFLSDYAAAPEGALTWRYERARGGNGVLGDLASHAVDLVRFVLHGEVDSVLADSAVFVAERLRPTGATSGHSVAADGVPGQVENDDHVAALLRLSTGARVAVEASRVAVGEQNAYGFEVHGTAGRLAWDFRRMGELQLSRGPAAQDQPVATLLVGPDAGEYAAFQPGAGIAMGYDDLKVVELRDLLASVVAGRPTGAALSDAVGAAVVLDAIAASAASGTRVDVPAG